MDVDLLIEDAQILTMADASPVATRMAVLNGHVVALDDDAAGLRATRTLRLNGATVVPGFNDAHCHPVMLGVTLGELDLSQDACATLEEVYAAVARRSREVPEGGWVVGSRYDQNKLGGHPHRDRLDQVAPGRKVWLKHTSGHMCVVNSELLADIGVLDGTARVPEGGVAARDAAGRLTGLLEEQAQRLVRDLVIPLSEHEIGQALDRACRLATSQGVTSWTDAGIGGGWIGHSPRELGAYAAARARGQLPVRTTVMVAADCLHPLRKHADDPGDLGLDLGIRTGFGDDRLRVGAVKVFTDGSLVGRTAAMCTHYHEEPHNSGYLQDSEETLRDRIVQAHLAGWQVACHAIGDRAVDLVLDALESAQRIQPRPDARHRIEHAGVVSDQQLERFQRLGVLPVPQGEFLSALGDGMIAAVGESRESLLYRQQSFRAAGLAVPGSSDRPVVPGAPLTGIRDLVQRQTASGRVLAGSERVTPEEALRSWTVDSAYAEHQDHRKGALTPGRLADFVVLGEDPLAVSPSSLSDIEVLATYVGGEKVFGGEGL